MLKERLKVPYVEQNNENSCGPAALEMVFKFYGININQNDIFEQYKKPNPDLKDNYYITTDDLVNFAKNNGFNESFWKKTDLTEKEINNLINGFIEKRIPIIACQQFTKEIPSGHFRVVTGIFKNKIYFHDPYDGPRKNWTMNKFIDYWMPSGKTVTGGVYIIIK